MPKPGPARRDPPPTRRGGGTGRIRQKSSAWPPPRGPAHPSREGGSCPHAVASSAGSYCLADFRRGGGWGVQVPQGPPLRSLEKAFSPRARRAPHTIARPFGDPREWEHSQKVGSQKGGGSAVWVKHTAHVSVHGQSREGKSLCCHQACLSDFSTWVEGCHVRKARRGPPLHISRPTAVALTTTCSLPGQGRSMGRATQGPRAALTGTQ